MKTAKTETKQLTGTATGITSHNVPGGEREKKNINNNIKERIYKSVCSLTINGSLIFLIAVSMNINRIILSAQQVAKSKHKTQRGKYNYSQ